MKVPSASKMNTSMFHGTGKGESAWEEVIVHCTVPGQLAVDKELEFRVKVGKTNTEGGPVMGREQGEEVEDRRTVSTTQVNRATQTMGKQCTVWWGDT